MEHEFKTKIKRVLAISMALSMLFCNNAFATPIDLANSTKSVQTDNLDKTQGTDYFEDETTNVWENGQITEEVRVKVDIESTFTICKTETLLVIRKLYGNKVSFFILQYKTLLVISLL